MHAVRKTMHPRINPAVLGTLLFILILAGVYTFLESNISNTAAVTTFPQADTSVSGISTQGQHPVPSVEGGGFAVLLKYPDKLAVVNLLSKNVTIYSYGTMSVWGRNVEYSATRHLAYIYTEDVAMNPPQPYIKAMDLETGNIVWSIRLPDRAGYESMVLSPNEKKLFVTIYDQLPGPWNPARRFGYIIDTGTGTIQSSSNWNTVTMGKTFFDLSSQYVYYFDMTGLQVVKMDLASNIIGTMPVPTSGYISPVDALANDFIGMPYYDSTGNPFLRLALITPAGTSVIDTPLPAGTTWLSKMLVDSRGTSMAFNGGNKVTTYPANCSITGSPNSHWHSAVISRNGGEIYTASSDQTNPIQIMEIDTSSCTITNTTPLAAGAVPTSHFALAQKGDYYIVGTVGHTPQFLLTTILNAYYIPSGEVREIPLGNSISFQIVDIDA